MSITVCNMLYVNNVKTVADFWKSVGFVEVSHQGEGEQETFVLSPKIDSDARLQLWNIDFIRQVSPEVAESKPSLLFTVDDIEAWHKKLSDLTDSASELNQVPFKNFNFQDPEGNYYAFAEQKATKF